MFSGSTPTPHPARRTNAPRFRLTALDRLAALCGTASRADALAHLVGLVRDSNAALWGSLPARGIFGVPSFVIDGEVFWGADAIGFGRHGGLRMSGVKGRRSRQPAIADAHDERQVTMRSRV